MRTLLDHDVPHAFRPHDEVYTARHMGWDSLKNGALMKAVQEATFDVLVTMNQGLSHQASTSQLMVVVLAVGSDQLDNLAREIHRFHATLDTARQGACLSRPVASLQGQGGHDIAPTPSHAITRKIDLRDCNLV